MLIGFATSGLPFTGESLKDGALGGSETALISMATAFARRGHHVRVYCNCPTPGVYDGVHYADRNAIMRESAILPFDVLIASRWPELLTGPGESGLRVAWLHDVLSDEGAFMGKLYTADLIMCLSKFHIENYCSKLGDIRPHIWQTRNGIDLDLIKENLRKKIPGKLIYTSRPERGLLYLLRDIFPKILARVPHARLHYCSYDLGKAMELPPEIRAIHDEVRRVAGQYSGNLIDMGGLKKADLYRQISSSQLLVYPTNFYEIFCISAIEAQACGTPIVTTNDFALSETVGDGGVLIDGLPKDQEYQSRFVDTVVDLLTDDEKYQVLAENGPKFVERSGCVWDVIAGQWEQKFKEMMEDRWRNNKQRILTNLVRKNDLSVATLMAKKEQLETLLPETADPKLLPGREVEPSRVGQEVKAMLPRVRKMEELLKLLNFHPQRILELHATDTALGMVLAGLYPRAAVTIQAVDEETAARISGYLDGAGAVAKQVCSVGVPIDEKFDLVVFHDLLDTLQSPGEFLGDVAKQYLAEGGILGFTTRYGTDRVLCDGTPNRRWNFDYQDLMSLAGESPEFRATLHDEAMTEGGELVGHWVTLCGGLPKYGKVDIRSKVLRTRPYESLTATIIARDEEDWISGCIKSVKGICDQIVVALDDRSTDRTAEIARSEGCDVIEVPFDNFGQIHNAAIDAARGDWILSIDADERLLGAGRLRPVLYSKVYNAYGVRQNHLMLDLHGTFDLPVRLFRRKPEYRYVGYIHEHCEDTSKGPYDNPISPTLVLEDSELLHYGYTNERTRRDKCSTRNLELLQRDIVDNGSKGRLLTRVLQIRDYLNIVKWSVERTGGALRVGSYEHKLLEAVVTDFRHYFGDRKHHYHDIAFPMYQEALEGLGRNGIPYRGRQLPPFQVAFALAGGVGGLESGDIASKERWFVDDAEFMEFIRNCGARLVTTLGVAPEDKYREDLTFKKPQPDGELPDPVALLEAGKTIGQGSKVSYRVRRAGVK